MHEKKSGNEKRKERSIRRKYTYFIFKKLGKQTNNKLASVNAKVTHLLSGKAIKKKSLRIGHEKHIM